MVTLIITLATAIVGPLLAFAFKYFWTKWQEDQERKSKQAQAIKDGEKQNQNVGHDVMYGTSDINDSIESQHNSMNNLENEWSKK